MQNDDRVLSVNEAIEQAIYARLDDIGAYKVIPNNQYKEARKKVNALYEQLKATLADEQQVLLMDIMDTIARQESISETIIYRQGLRDGLALPKAWGGAFNG